MMANCQIQIFNKTWKKVLGNKYLIFDTETTGTNKAKDRIVQIAWFLTNDEEESIERVCHVIKPSGFNIPEASTRIHGVTDKFAQRNGCDLAETLRAFVRAAKQSDYLVGHNIDFDISILRNDLKAAGIEWSFLDKPRICTMRLSTAWCRIPKYTGLGFKWPKLEELHYKLFGSYFDNAHDALFDVDATAKCFFKLIEIGIIEVPSPRDKSEVHRPSATNSQQKAVHGKNNQASPSADKYSTKNESFFQTRSEDVSDVEAKESTVKEKAPSDTKSTCKAEPIFSSRPFNSNSKAGRSQSAISTFTSTQKINTMCSRCKKKFTVTLVRYEKTTRCPACHSVVQCQIDW